MLNKLQALKQNHSREEGFSLIEVMVAILVIGILTAIIVPTYINSQNEINSQSTKAALQSAGLAIEQEAIDNNGLYPTYMPNELKNNPESAKYVYSYNDERTAWCLQAPSTVGKLFVSSSSGGKIIAAPCTEENIAEGSDTPWVAPVVKTPNVPVIASHSWASNETTAKTTLTLSGSSCTLSSADQAEWGSKTILQYRAKAVNNARSGETVFTSWSPNTSVNFTLPGWLPGEEVAYSTQARCLISNGIDYSYASSYSPEVKRNVATFVVNPISFSNTTGTWINASTFRAVSSWSAAFCPAGTKQYLLAIKSSGGSTMAGSTTWNSWAQSDTSDATAWASGGTTTFTHTVGCLLPNGTRITSTPTVDSSNNTIRPPAIPGGLVAVDSDTAAITPTGVKWNAVTCQTGTPQYLLTRIVGGSWNSGWIAGTALDLTLAVNTNYSYNVEARCVSGSLSSTGSGDSASVSFTTRYTIPDAPGKVGTYGHNGTGPATFKDNVLTWQAVTCVNSTPQYAVRQIMKNGDAITTSQPSSGWTISGTSYQINSSWLPTGSTVQFEANARCVGAGGTSPEAGWTTSADAKWTTSIDAPTSPTSLSFTNAGNATWSAPSTKCDSGATLQYIVVNGTWNGGWQTATSATLGSYSDIGGKTYTAKVKARCVGSNTSSSESSYTSATRTLPYKQATTTSHSDGNCSNFRSNHSTGSSVYNCVYGGNGPIDLTQYCNDGGYTWFKTPWGWSTSGNLNNASTARVENAC